MSRYSLWNPFLVVLDPRTFKGDSSSSSSSSNDNSSSSSSSSSTPAPKAQAAPKQDTTPTFNTLAEASAAGYHGQAVNIAGKGKQKVEFADKSYNDKMANVSANANAGKTSVASAASSQPKSSSSSSGTVTKSTVTAGNSASSSGAKTMGQVSDTGQYAGDGMEWVKEEGTNALTRTYTGVGKDNNLGTDVIAGGTADKNTKEAIASVSLNEGSTFASSPGSATDGSVLDLFRDEEDKVGSGSFAEQTGVVDYTPRLTTSAPSTPAPEPVKEKTFGETFRENLEAGNKTFEYKGDIFTTELAPEPGIPSVSTPAAAAPSYATMGIGEAGRGANVGYVAPEDTSQARTDAAKEEDLFEQPVTTPESQNFIDGLPDYEFDPLDFIGTPVETDAGRVDTSAKDADMGVGATPFTYVPKANTYTESLQEIADQSRAGTIGADEASALLGLGAGQPLTDTEVAAIMPPVIPTTSALDTGADFVPSGVVPEQKTGLVGEEFDPRTIMPTSEQVAIATGTAQEPVDLTPAFSVEQFIEDTPILDNIIGAGEIDTPGEKAGAVIRAGTEDLLPGLAAQGTEQLVSAALETGRDLNIPGFGQEFVTDPMFKYRQAGLGDMNALSQIAQEQELFRTGVPEEVGPAAIRAPSAQTAVESALQSYADRQFRELGESIGALPEDVQSALSRPAVNIPQKFGYGEGQVDPAFAAALEEDPNAYAFGQTTVDPEALAYQALLTAPTALSTVAASFVNPAAGGILGGTLAGGEGQRASNIELNEALQSGELKTTPAYEAYARAAEADPSMQGLTQEQKDSRILNQMRNDVSQGLVPLNVLSGAISAATPAMLRRGIPGVIAAPAAEAVEEGPLETGITNIALQRQAGLERSATPTELASEAAVGAVSAAPVGVAGIMGTQQGLDVSKSPTAGTPAQVPPGVQTAYKEAADTMGEAGVGGVGATDAISLDVMAAQEIINDQIASTGTVDAKVLQNLRDATDLSMEELGTMVANAGSRMVGSETIPVDVPGGVSDALIDQPTGIGGGSNIQVTPLPSGETMLTNNDTGRQTIVDQGANLQEAIATFDEVTTPIDEQTVALREQAAAEINKIPVFSSVQGTGGITDAAEAAITSKMDADAAATTAPEIAEDTGFAPEQQLEMLLEPEQTQQLDLLASTEPEPEPEPAPAPAPAPEPEPTPAPEPEDEPAPAPEVEVEPEPEPEPPVVVEVGPDEDEVAEDEEVEVELEPEVEEPVTETEPEAEPPTDIFVPPVVTTDDDGNEVTECPEGYRMVTTGEGPMCMKSFSMERQRAGAGTRAYTGLAGNIGRRGPGQRRKVTTQTQRVRPTVRRT